MSSPFAKTTLSIVQSNAAPVGIGNLTPMSTAVGAQTNIATNAASGTALTRYIGVSVAPTNDVGMTGGDAATINDRPLPVVRYAEVFRFAERRCAASGRLGFAARASAAISDAAHGLRFASRGASTTPRPNAHPDFRWGRDDFRRPPEFLSWVWKCKRFRCRCARCRHRSAHNRSSRRSHVYHSL